MAFPQGGGTMAVGSGISATAAVTGAVVAAVLGFLHPIIPALATIHTDPLVHCGIANFIRAGMCWALFAGICGAIVGAIGASKRHIIVAAGIGAVSFIGLHFVFFTMMTSQLLSRMPLQNALATLAVAGLTGAISSVAGAIAGRANSEKSEAKDPWQFSLRELLFIAILFTLMISCEMQLVAISPTVAEIEKHYGEVLWVGDIDSEALWKIRLTDSRVGDEELLELLPILRSTQDLELDLRGSSVTDKGLTYLSSLTNLSRLWLDSKSTSDAEMKQLRKSLPATKVETRKK